MEPKPNYYLVEPLAYTGQATAFTYQSDSELTPGQVVEVPLGRRQSLAVVRQSVDKPDFATKSVTQALELPPLPPYFLQLVDWMSDYYAASPSAVWGTLLPAGLTRKRRAVKSKKAKSAAGLPDSPLTSEQVAALKAIRADKRPTQLIEGVTGSGKTRLYLELAAEALAAGRSVIVLVPEITLTPQLVGQFEAAFGEVVLSTHSRLGEAERHRQWQAAMDAFGAGQARVVVGPRSSLFLPVHQLGLVVVDECHETSYKQEQQPRYDALTAAAQLVRMAGGRLVLGSATPNLRELVLARDGRIGHVRLTKRAGGQPAPTVTVVDLRQKELLRRSKFISNPLLEALEETLAEGRQSVLFINRRGSASSQICGDCGTVTNCPNCALPLTFHADLLRLVCHHCNFRQTPVAVCAECGSTNLRYLGGGTKRIEAEITSLFPKARLARLDRDSGSFNHIKEVYSGLQDGTIDILIGTQMIAKGLDLPRIDTIGVVSADTMLHLPDFGAAERTYALLTQVSGRAGRGDRPGRVIIQSYTPDHPAIMAAAQGKPEAFLKAELEERRTLGYPPLVALLKLTYGAATRETATAEAEGLASVLRRRQGVTVVGPAPAFLEQQSGKFHWQLAVKAPRRSSLVEIARSLPDTWTADLDPLNLL